MGNTTKCQIGIDDPERLEHAISLSPLHLEQLNEVYNNFLHTLKETKNEENNSTSQKSFETINPLIKSDVIKTFKDTSLFLNCLNEKYTINQDEYNNYIYKLIQKNNKQYPYSIHYLEYYYNLKSINFCIPIIGSILILNSKGDKNEKINLLVDIFKKCNDNLFKDTFKMYIYGLIQANTVNVIDSFYSLFNDDSIRKLSDVFNEIRRKKLCEYIMNNYDSVLTKYFSVTESNAKFLDLISEENIKILKEIFQLTFNCLEGTFIRTWLFEEYDRIHSNFEPICCDN